LRATAQEIVTAHGGRATDSGTLGAGELHFATESSGHPAKLRTPTGLIDHPADPGSR